MFSVRFDSNANIVSLESRTWVFDCLSGFSIRVKQKNVDLQITGLYPNTSTDSIILYVALSVLRNFTCYVFLKIFDYFEFNRCENVIEEYRSTGEPVQLDSRGTIVPYMLFRYGPDYI